MEQINQILEIAKDASMQQKEDELLLQPFTYIDNIPGKKIFAQLPTALNYWLHIPEEKLSQIVETSQMLRSCSLLLDDIEDNSLTRRSIPSAHVIYGVASAINAANYSCFIAMEKILKLGRPEAAKIFAEEALMCCRGQGMEIYWRDNFICPSEMDYKLMAARKSGGFFMLTIRLMQLFSKNKKDFTKLAAILGIYYQIWDDYRNLTFQGACSDNKSIAEDLTEGKFGYPVLHAARKPMRDNQILHIVRQRTRDIDLKKYCLTLLDSAGSFEYTRKVLISLDREARAEVQRLGGNPLMDEILDKMLSHIISDENKNATDSTK